MSVALLVVRLGRYASGSLWCPYRAASMCVSLMKTTKEVQPTGAAPCLVLFLARSVAVFCWCWASQLELTVARRSTEQWQQNTTMHL